MYTEDKIEMTITSEIKIKWIMKITIKIKMIIELKWIILIKYKTKIVFCKIQNGKTGENGIWW